MREKDVHNLIEQQDNEAKRRIWQKISAQVDVEPVPSKQTASKKKTTLISVLAAVLVCLVTLSIALPIALRDNEPKSRFCDGTQYAVIPFNQTLKEYSLSKNNGLLYVDWYDIADDVTTVYAHINDDADDIVYLSEFIANGETGELLTIYITDNRTQVDFLQAFNNVGDEDTVKNITVKYGSVQFDSVAVFEYENHIYYLTIYAGGGQARLTEIIEDMLK